jgi:hypothetical protein
MPIRLRMLTWNVLKWVWPTVAYLLKASSRCRRTALKRLFLGNGRETNNGTKPVARQQIFNKQLYIYIYIYIYIYTAVAEYRLREQIRSHGDEWDSNGRAVFCTWSMPSGYKQDQL